MARFRRPAREAALQALYKIEIAKSPISTAIAEMREHAELPEDLADYADRLVQGVRSNQAALDRRLAPLIRQYDYDRLAVVDKNILRIGAYELLMEESIPPVVTIDEAIEIARKYSSLESGGFVNGVLDALRKESPKAHWDAATAPVEAELPSEEPAEPVEVVEEPLRAGSPEAERLARIGGWKLRADESGSGDG